jgi:chromate transporter
MLEVLHLCLVCLRVGTLVFGGGLVLVPLLEADVVDRYHWLTHQEFVDAVALGQMTPGPLLVTATLIGYKVGGEASVEAGGIIGYHLGGVLAGTAATLSLFLPSFLMVIALTRHLKRLQANPLVKRFLWGARSAVVGLLVATGTMLAQQHLTSPGAAILGVVALGLMVLTDKVDTSLIVVASGLIGLVLWSA